MEGNFLLNSMLSHIFPLLVSSIRNVKIIFVSKSILKLFVLSTSFSLNQNMPRSSLHNWLFSYRPANASPSWLLTKLYNSIVCYHRRRLRGGLGFLALFGEPYGGGLIPL